MLICLYAYLFMVIAMHVALGKNCHYRDSIRKALVKEPTDIVHMATTPPHVRNNYVLFVCLFVCLYVCMFVCMFIWVFTGQ